MSNNYNDDDLNDFNDNDDILKEMKNDIDSLSKSQSTKK